VKITEPSPVTFRLLAIDGSTVMNGTFYLHDGSAAPFAWPDWPATP
jgi:hypothetical protein